MKGDLELLVARYLEGTASPKERCELDRLVRTDAEAARTLFLAADQDAATREFLSTCHGRDEIVRLSASPRYRLARRRRNPIWVAAAALLCALALALLLIQKSAPTPLAAGNRPRAPLVPPGDAPAVPPFAPVPERPSGPNPEPPTARPGTVVVPTPQPPPPLPSLEPPAPLPTLQSEPKPELAPGPPPPPPTPKTGETVAPVARVGRAVGLVYILTENERTPAKGGEGLFAGQGLETCGAWSLAVVSFADGTQLELTEETAVEEFREGDAKAGRGKRVVLKRGAITAEVARQPKDLPLVLSTPHAEAKVLGTSLRILADAQSTHLEVTEGKVRLTRSRDGKSVDVVKGYHAAATDLAAKPLPANLLVDSGFEEGGRRWVSGQLGAKDFARDGRVVQTPVRRGGRSLMLLGKGERNVRQGVPVEPGVTYAVEGWLKDAGEASPMGMSVIWMPSRDAYGWLRPDKWAAGLEYKGWTRFSGCFTAPAEAKWAWVTLHMDGATDLSKVWFDDLYLGKRP